MKINRITTIGMILMCLMISCNNKEKKNTSSLMDTVKLASTSSENPRGDFSDSTFEGFNRFWQKFRTSVIHSDTAQIMSLTFFPLQTRGTFDDDPIEFENKERFDKVFFVFLNQWDGQNLDGLSQLDLIQKMEKPNGDIHNKQVRIGDMVFTFKNGDWKLSFLYFNEETKETLRK